MQTASQDSFNIRKTLEAAGRKYHYYDLTALDQQTGGKVSRLPYCMKILLENLLRHEGGEDSRGDIEAVINWDPKAKPDREIAFTPSRVLLQDFTGVPAVVDLAVMRDAMDDLGGDPSKINPMVPAELVIDHSVQVDVFGSTEAFLRNVEREYERNRERYAFLRWGQTAFEGFKVVPPATGIVHQVNLEFLARVVFGKDTGDGWLAYPDTLVGTDSHTTMINGLGVLGWGVGGIEAEAAMLGQPISMLIPQVVGFKLTGKLREGATATDLVLTVTEMLRKKGVVNKFVEFYGEGLPKLSLADRATLGNMSPEFGSTCAISPVDEETLKYLRLTNRGDDRIALVEAYCKAQGLFHTEDSPDAEYSDSLELDLQDVVPSIAGPKRPQDRIALSSAKQAFEKELETTFSDTYRIAVGEGSDGGGTAVMESPVKTCTKVELSAEENAGQPASFELEDGAVVIAAITSCTNTSNPTVMVGAGLLAKKAAQKGLNRKPWVKTSLAPGSKVVTDYLDKSGLTHYLELLGFDLVGYGCTTCIGNSGPLPEPISKAVREHNMVVCSVLSGNRNFEGRINPDTRANYLASPPLVVAYALAGRMDIDLYNEPLGNDRDGQPVYLKDIWPSLKEIQETIASSLDSSMFAEKYSDVYGGTEEWKQLPIPEGDRYQWSEESTYIRQPTFFADMGPEPEPVSEIKDARVLALLGDTVTTDHISPAGSIPKNGPAGQYLIERGVKPHEFNSFGSRRGNHEVMVRGTFGNIRLRNLLVEKEGGWTKVDWEEEPVSIFEAANGYRERGIPLIVIAGKEYGTGSSRDWAAKGTLLLGVKAVIAESYERIHRSNLIGMGVLPLQFKQGEGRKSLELDGSESYTISGLDDGLKPGRELTVTAEKDGQEKSFKVVTRIDTANEMQYYRHGGILHYVLRSLLDS
ncbi:MAG TPA: aconitate hydratase AcnA [Acidobacteriota bacterium]|nr:aconitate hydratase AcnA [Acidobacteriota bacterium]